MTVDQRVQWIALPAGAVPDGNSLRLSLFVAPRLRTDEGSTLMPFRDFWDWPAKIRDATFAVQVGGATVAATVESAAPDSPLWTALFSPTTPLTPFVFDDYADRPFVTYSVGDVLGALRTVYARVAAAAPDNLPHVRGRANAEPPTRGLIDLFDELRGVTRGILFQGAEAQRRERVRLLLEDARNQAARRRAPGAMRGGPLLEPLPSDGTVARHFERALLFHVRPASEPVEMPSNGQHFKDTVDFHQMLAAVGDHPWLLRRLGLVIDLVVRATDIPMAAVPTVAELSVKPTWTSEIGDASVDVLPHTAYIYQVVDGGTFFAAAHRQPDPAAPPGAPPTGLLQVPPNEFALEQVDVDGSALKAINLSATLEAVAGRPDPTQTPLHEPEETGVPVLRTSGLALVRAGRAADLQKTFGRHVETNDAIEHGASPTLFAEDLVRGYRLDVFDAVPGTWRSLHARVITATAARLAEPLPPMRDEGFFQLSLAGAATPPGQAPDPNAEVYVHETLITWDGWSLSAPRPGQTLSSDSSAAPARVANDAFNAMGLKLNTGIAVGTLPRLRFGRGYRVRVRTVDLAGNGPTLAEADRLLASPFTATPALPAAGASRYLRFEPVAAPTLVPAQHFGEGASLRRLVIRSNGGVLPDKYAADFNATDLVTSGSHAPYEGHDDRHVAPPKGAFELVERHGRLDEVMGSDSSPPPPDRQAAIRAAYEIARREKGSFDDPSLPTVELVELSSGPAPPQRYVVHHEDQLVLPYLPDPLAAGALFFGLPGQPAGEPFKVLFEGPQWWEIRPLRLRLAGGSGPPEWDAAQRVLTVRLPQTGAAIVRVCSLHADIGQMGILRWCEQVLGGEELDSVIRAAKENRSWLITPWHTLDLVHAVQQPLAEPEWVRFDVLRGRDQPSADLYGEVTIDVRSTEKIDVLAAWNETVDDLARPGPEVHQAESAVFDLAVRVAATGRTDTDPHEIPYSLRDKKLLTFFTTLARERLLPTPAAQMFGDTRYRRVTYRVMATTPFREYFPPDWAKKPDLLTRTSAPRVTNVPSSSPPAPPQVLYAVPTLGWEAIEQGGAIVRRRRGGGLRVYLARPWFSSGDGEMLGVVVGAALTSPKAEDYPYITLLGQDPVRGGAPLEFATPATFRNATLVTDPIQPLELPGRVTVAAFAPAYDAGTQRWFCDIDLDTHDAYLPFVRLALVRYQPQSLPGCALSRIVLADISQTLPDRTLTVTRTPEAPEALEITVAGPSYTAIRGVGTPRLDDPALARMVARVEQRDAAIPDELLGWRAVVGAEVELMRTLAGVAATWTGRLPLPPGDGTPRRLVVLEEEHMAVDEQTPGQGGLGTRVVYADIVEV